METQKPKSSHEGIYNYLRSNPDKKVKEIMPEIENLCFAKRGGNGQDSFIKDASGATVAIHTVIGDRWLPVVGSKAVAVSDKKGTNSGLSSYSKEGSKVYSMRLAARKKAEEHNEAVRERCMRHEIDIAQRDKELVDIAAINSSVPEGYAGNAFKEGFATKDEVVAYLKDEGVKVAA